MRHATLLVCTAILAATTAAGPLYAQEEDRPIIYGSYYQCGPGTADIVDRLAAAWSPAIRPQIDAGAVTAWGILTHDTGNEWDVVLYTVGPELAGIRSATQAAAQTVGQQDAELFGEFGAACPSHDDYVWVSRFSSADPADVAQDRSPAGLSVYWVCTEAREAIADLIFESLMVPVLNEQVAAGLVNSWSWNEHFLGGKYRRLLALDGPDHASLLEARNAMIDAFSERPGVAAAFNEVCDGHQDNLYQIHTSEP